MPIENAMKDDTVDRHRVRNAKRKVRAGTQPDNLKKFDRVEGDHLGDRQEVPSSQSNAKCSSSSEEERRTRC